MHIFNRTHIFVLDFMNPRAKRPSLVCRTGKAQVVPYKNEVLHVIDLDEVGMGGVGVGGLTLLDGLVLVAAVAVDGRLPDGDPEGQGGQSKNNKKAKRLHIFCSPQFHNNKI